MAVGRGYCGTDGKPVRNREYKLNPKQSEELIYSTFKGSINSLLETLNRIRLATLLEQSTTTGKMKAVYKLEEMTDQEQDILRALAIDDFHHQRPTLKGVSVYA